MSELKLEEKQDEKENKTIAGISTAVILILLFVLMLFLVFGATTVDDDLEGGGGVAVSLGEPDAGGPSTEASAPQSKKTQSVQEQVDDPVLSQDDDDAPTVKTTQKTPTKKPEKKVDSDLSDILGGLKDRKKTQGTGDGSQTGNQGQKNGSESGNGDGRKGTGGKGTGTSDGVGTGFSSNLAGRRVVQAPPKSSDFYTNGTVTIKITVNSSGKVINAQIDRPSSNDPKLQSLAKQLAYQAKYDAKFGAPDQVGKVTFTFSL